MWRGEKPSMKLWKHHHSCKGRLSIGVPSLESHTILKIINHPWSKFIGSPCWVLMISYFSYFCLFLNPCREEADIWLCLLKVVSVMCTYVLKKFNFATFHILWYFGSYMEKGSTETCIASRSYKSTVGNKQNLFLLKLFILKEQRTFDRFHSYNGHEALKENIFSHG